ncbi:hypothetical protein VTN00DRAFT_423 [Thermoascus crustaceus]|uniref:uncharacterized protein n=1 Tax=Thermoascus crustaceus TaxID=5088 RepID=UPI003742D2A2
MEEIGYSNPVLARATLGPLHHAAEESWPLCFSDPPKEHITVCFWRGTLIAAASTCQHTNRWLSWYRRKRSMMRRCSRRGATGNLCPGSIVRTGLKTRENGHLRREDERKHRQQNCLHRQDQSKELVESALSRKFSSKEDEQGTPVLPVCASPRWSHQRSLPRPSQTLVARACPEGPPLLPRLALLHPPPRRHASLASPSFLLDLPHALFPFFSPPFFTHCLCFDVAGAVVDVVCFPCVNDPLGLDNYPTNSRMPTVAHP